MHTQTTGKRIDGLVNVSRTRIVEMLQLSLDALGELMASGNFRPLDSSPTGGRRQYGTMTETELKSLHAIADRHRNVAKENGEGLTDRQLTQRLRLVLRALGALLVQQEFTANPNLEAAASRYRIESAAKMQELLVLVLAELEDAPLVTDELIQQEKKRK